METDKDNRIQACEEYPPDKGPMKDEQNKGLIGEIIRENIQLTEEIKKLEAELQVDTRDFQIKEDIPKTKMKFVSV
uniref:Nmi/IFP 35 domain-containing protein n=2 Tax=Nannospalax galili TaxID=1026970 RepID=A0A8C6R266_NANGA